MFNVGLKVIPNVLPASCRQHAKKVQAFRPAGASDPPATRFTGLGIRTSLAIHTLGTSCGKRNCDGHGVSSVVARASRPCESCNRHTGLPAPGLRQAGETPVPLPSAVIPKRARRAVLEVLAAMPERSQQHTQMLPQRIKMGLARGGHEWMPV